VQSPATALVSDALAATGLAVRSCGHNPRLCYCDFSQGNDHELLLGIDRLLDKEVPSALEPALVLTKEIVKKKQ
jgi:hypothetical protein